MSDETTTKAYLTTPEVAARLRRTETTIRSWRQRGIGPPYIQPAGRGTKVLYDLAAVEAWEKQGSTP